MTRNPHYGLIIGYCAVFSGNIMVSTFQLAFFLKLVIFFKVFENLCRLLGLSRLASFKIFQPQGSENLLKDLIICGCIVFSCNRMVFNFLISQIFSICFLYNLRFYQVF